MFGKTWKTSELKYKVLIERGVKIPMRDGIELNADIFRPDSDEKFPAILGYHPYDQVAQTAPIIKNSLSTNFSSSPVRRRAMRLLKQATPMLTCAEAMFTSLPMCGARENRAGFIPSLLSPKLRTGATS